MFIRKLTNSKRNRTTYQVCTAAAERGEIAGTFDVLFASESFYDASLVLRFLTGGALSDAQLERYIDVVTKNTDADTNQSTGTR